MGNLYPAAISTYPTWVAHETPYTAEWGNSVGYEFYLIEYELGENPRGEYKDLATRLDAMTELIGFSYFARGYYIQTLSYPAIHTIPLYFERAQNDQEGVFDLVGRRNITAKKSGWYEIIWHAWIEVSSGTFPSDARLYVFKSEAPNYDEIGLDFQVIQGAGWYTLTAHCFTYLNAGQYVYAEITVDQDLALFTRHDWASQGIVFRQINDLAYEVR